MNLRTFSDTKEIAVGGYNVKTLTYADNSAILVMNDKHSVFAE